MKHHTNSQPARLVRTLCAAAGALALAAGAAQAKPTASFSIQQVLSAPFPSSLVATTTAAGGNRVAWVYNRDGARNVWVAEPGSGGMKARAITSYNGDDGADMGELAWDPSGRQVFYSYGGSLEGGGPVNIMSRPGGPGGQQIWAAQVGGGAPRLVGDGHTPVVSPRGDQVAFVSGEQIWTAPVDGSGKAAQLLHDRGQASDLAWSPDGTRIAFVSTRGDHSVVGVYDFQAQSIHWLAPSVDTDREPQWSPDGKRLAFVRIPAGAGGYFFERRQGQPWSIWVADAATGAGRQAWISDKGPGSVFANLQSGPNLFWLAGDQIVFPWEKTGWLHLYSVSASGGQPRLLTPGEFEIFSPAVSADRSRIVYSANQNDIDHRHLWEVNVASGAARPVTSGDSIEDYPAITGDGRLFALHGDAKNQIRPVSLDGAQMRDVAPGVIPADFPTARLVEPKQVVFTAADGIPVHAQLFLPPAGKASRGPAVLFFHGGPIRQMLLGFHPMDAYNYMYGMNQYLASEGYVVLSVNYRGGVGYGTNFREAKDFAAGGGSELNDILGAALYLRSRSDVDPNRVGIWGGSYGGLMTAYGLARAPDLLAAGVDYAGVHDWRGLLPGLPADKAQLAFDSSAMATIDKWRSPVLIVHADDDRNVPFSQSVQLVTALRKNGMEPEQVVIPDEIHDLLRHQSWITLFSSADDFFDRKLWNAPSCAAAPGRGGCPK